jgi:Sensors of blue-light using FAD
MQHYEALYVSELSPETSTTEVARILVHARASNRARGIAGLLLFDGARFVQMLSGSEAMVTMLMQSIRDDPRHHHISMLHEGVVAIPTFTDFNVGYWYVDDEAHSAIELKKYLGVSAVKALLDRREAFDL